MTCQPAPSPRLNDRLTLVGMDEVSSLCSSGSTPNILTGFLTAVMRDHFSRPENLEYGGKNEHRLIDGVKVPVEELQRYVWIADRANSSILIDPVWKYNREDIQRRPAILIKRNRTATAKVAIGDGMTIAGGADGRVPGRYQTRSISGSHTLFCVAGSGAEAELLGAEVFGHLLGFAQVLREELRLHAFDVESLEAISHFEEFDDKFVVPVTVVYTAVKAWRTDTVSPWLKSLGVDVGSR